MVVISDLVAESQLQETNMFKTITVEKKLDLEYDLGTLLCVDTNELDEGLLNSRNDKYLQNLVRDNVQLLINKIWDLPTDKVDDVIVAKLPKPTYLLPRAKRVPKPKPLTKWQEFAKLKGIQKKKKSKLSWDEHLKKWIPLYGYKRAEAVKNKDWLLEVPQNADPMEDQFAKKADSKSERVAKNSLQHLRNIAKSRNIKIPRMGLLNADMSTAKDLQAAVTVARSSTASVGKFQNSLPKEKDARGISAITPGGSSRKRKSSEMNGMEQTSRPEEAPRKRRKTKANKGKKKPRSGKSKGGRKRR